MSAVTDMLDALVEGRTTLGQTVARFRDFTWHPQAEVAEDAPDDPAPAENSFDEVQYDSRLTPKQYAQLGDAYRAAVGGQDE